MSNSALCGTEITAWTPYEINFSYSYLQHVTFGTGEYYWTDFLGADLRNAVLGDMHAENSRFTFADLRNARFHGGDFNDANFEGADLRDIVTEPGIEGVDSNSAGYMWGAVPNFDSKHEDWPSIFDERTTSRDALKKLSLAWDTDEDIFLVDFAGARFKSADLRGAHLENSNISQAQIDEACTDTSTVVPAGLTPGRCDISPQVSEIRDSVRAVLVSNVGMSDSCSSALTRLREPHSP